jgi:hypothetical protein
VSRLRRTTVALLLSAAIATTALTATGCGAVSHAVGGIVAHKIANHVLGDRTAGKVFCIYHGHRLVVDLRHRSKLAAAINAYEAYRSCKAGFGHRSGG